MSRLTHLCEFKDKRKNREPMLKIRNKLFNYENIEEKHNIKSLDDLDNRLKAFEIIKKKKVDVSLLFDYISRDKTLRFGALGTYNLLVDKSKELTPEEFDLLKEVLSWVD